MDTTKKVAAVALVGLGAYAYYKFVYLPQKVRGILAGQAAAAGMSTDAYMAKIGAVASVAWLLASSSRHQTGSPGSGSRLRRPPRQRARRSAPRCHRWATVPVA